MNSKKNSNWRNKNTEELITTILRLKNREQGALFLRDLMTERELIEMGNRWKAARMLHRGFSYKDIFEKQALARVLSRGLITGLLPDLVAT